MKNLCQEIGIEIEETDYGFKENEKAYLYKDHHLSVEPFFLYESARDINNEEYMSIEHHELILHFIIKLPNVKEKTIFNINGDLIDGVAWVSKEELTKILNKENSTDCVAGLAHRNKKSLHRERIVFSQMEPFYPNSSCGEGMVRDDYYAYKHLLDNWKEVSDLSLNKNSADNDFML